MLKQAEQPVVGAAGAGQPGSAQTDARGGAFPDGQSALMLVAARLRHVAGTRWGSRRYLDMSRLREPALTETTTEQQTTAAG